MKKLQYSLGVILSFVVGVFFLSSIAFASATPNPVASNGIVTFNNCPNGKQVYFFQGEDSHLGPESYIGGVTCNGDDSPKDVDVNNSITSDPPAFPSFLYVIVDTNLGALDYASALAEPSMIEHGSVSVCNGACPTGHPAALAIGGLINAPVTQVKTEVSSGMVIVLKLLGSLIALCTLIYLMAKYVPGVYENAPMGSMSGTKRKGARYYSKLGGYQNTYQGDTPVGYTRLK